MKPLRRSYQFGFNHPVDKLWKIIADTPRWAEASGFPRYQSTEQLQADGSVKVFGYVEISGFRLNWEEPPANWVFERWFEQERLFQNGPFVCMSTRAVVNDEYSQSSLDMEVSFTPRNLIGYILGRRLLSAFRAKVEQLLEKADSLIEANNPDLFTTDFKYSPLAQERTDRAIKEINQTAYSHGLVQKLIDYIAEKQDVDLTTMRPLALARRWQVDVRLVVELFLQSVRTGLLESRWDVLCPRCRVSRAQIDNMADLPDGVHCDACNIDYQADFASNVELSFSPVSAIRSVESGYFCRSGPGATPHIKEQYSLGPGETSSFPLELSPGDYRLRTLEAGDELDVTVDSETLPEIIIHQSELTFGETAPTGQLVLHNKGNLQRTIVVEDRSWLLDVLTAERVTTMQAFRDLFSEQVLRPGDDIRIRNITFIFTDLVDSTALFETIGDARAYQLVRAHFSVLGEIVRDHDGSIVKTVGDGIHAAFLTPDAALRASIEMQQAMVPFNQDMASDDIAIRIGINSGSSISVTLNGLLDYYGSTVNLAARLQGEGSAGDITMSAAFVDDPAVTKMLQNYTPRKFEATIKGVEEVVPVFQISP